MAYTVFRSDLLSGTDVAADLVSCRVLESDEGDPIAVENGTIVELKGYEAGQREVMKAVPATSASELKNCVVIGTPEVMYDEHKKNLDQFVNEKGAICRGYVLRDRNMFSVTKEGFQGGVAPELNATLGIGTNGKINPSGTGLGKCVAIENVGRHTYYVVMIDSAKA